MAKAKATEHRNKQRKSTKDQLRANPLPPITLNFRLNKSYLTRKIMYCMRLGKVAWSLHKTIISSSCGTCFGIKKRVFDAPGVTNSVGLQEEEAA
jgi:hypothetical protein